MDSPGERLKLARKEAGYRTAEVAADAMGISKNTYGGHEASARGLRPKVAEKYARKFGVNLEWLLTGRGSMKRGPKASERAAPVAGLPMLGQVQAGQWRDASINGSDAEPEMVEAPQDRRFPRDAQYVVRVVGDSMDKLFRDGSYVVCVDFGQSGLDIKPDLIVHVERWRSGGQLVENTLKKVVREKGKWMLAPESTNPAYRPFPVEGPDGDEVIIRGLVLKDYRDHQY